MQKDHAAWIHTAIQNLLSGAHKDISEVKAIAISAGPGSYTGLRVGMATAKGLCYALEIPLISIDTLILMAKAAMEKISFEQMPPGFLLVPMIDARRMEVFTAVIDQALNFT
jgi:tRNA threonylcarbamoyladenosine biosynthesis protein TsaB